MPTAQVLCSSDTAGFLPTMTVTKGYSGGKTPATRKADLKKVSGFHTQVSSLIVSLFNEKLGSISDFLSLWKLC